MKKILYILFLFPVLAVAQNKSLPYTEGGDKGTVLESALKINATNVFDWWKMRDSTSNWIKNATGIYYQTSGIERVKIEDSRVNIGGITNRYSKLNILGGVNADSFKLNAVNSSTAFINHANKTSNLSVDANGIIVNTVNPLTISNMDLFAIAANK
jgi:hypothetical protein